MKEELGSFERLPVEEKLRVSKPLDPQNIRMSTHERMDLEIAGGNKADTM